MKLLQLGAFDHPDPEVRRNILESFEIGGLERMFFQLDAQRRRARIENEMFRNPDLENLEFHLLDTGHFALEEDGDRIAALMKRFLANLSD